MQNKREKFKENFIKRLVNFSVNVLKFGEQMRKQRTLWSIVDQLARSASSVGANVVKAKASSSKRDYLKFFEIALKSANETRYWLIVVKETIPELNNQTELLLKEIDEISRIIGASVLTLKGKK